MVQKDKNHIRKLQKSNLLAQLSLATMIIATLAACAEAAVHEGQKLAAALQPNATHASIGQKGHHQPGHEIRRAGGPKEEIQHSSASFGGMKRSASVAGSL